MHAPGGFEQAIPAIKQLQNYALYHMTTEISIDGIWRLISRGIR
jgi:hypothetical protein